MCAYCGHVIRNYEDVGAIGNFSWGAVLLCHDCAEGETK